MYSDIPSLGNFYKNGENQHRKEKTSIIGCLRDQYRLRLSPNSWKLHVCCLKWQRRKIYFRIHKLSTYY